jgi:hypothetical protein
MPTGTVGREAIACNVFNTYSFPNAPIPLGPQQMQWRTLAPKTVDYATWKQQCLADRLRMDPGESALQTMMGSRSVPNVEKYCDHQMRR